MKTIFYFLSRPIALVTILALSISACDLNDDETTKPVLSGEGRGISSARPVKGFTGIELEADVDVFVQSGPVAKIEVEAQKNLQPYVLTYVTGSKLIIKTSGNLNPTEKIKVFVTVPTLTNVQITGAGRVIGSNTFATEELTTQVEGAGRIDLAVEAKEIRANLNGSGSIYLEGNTAAYKATINGSGTIETHKLVTKTSV